MCSCNLGYAPQPLRHLCITARKLCARPLPAQIAHLAQLGCIDTVILREKDMSEAAYETLARQVQRECDCAQLDFVVHTFSAVAQRLGCATVHLPLPLLRAQGRPPAIECVGASVHSVAQALEACQLGANYLVASPIFATDCKPGQPGRGSDFLREVVAATTLPVYALGGITDATEPLLTSTGAQGFCRRSHYMRPST
ncbi:MAG: thiamine phosphate synthase [Raoultibacter sp.]